MNNSNYVFEKLDDTNLGMVTGGNSYDFQHKYNVGDVVEVWFGIKDWTNRGEITDIRVCLGKVQYYVKFEDWFMKNSWQFEGYIRSKVR